MFVILDNGSRAVNINLVNELEIVKIRDEFVLTMTIKGQTSRNEILCCSSEKEKLKKILEQIATGSECAYLMQED